MADNKNNTINRLARLFNGIAIASTIFLLIVAIGCILFLLWLYPIDISLNPLKITIEINRQPYKVEMSNVPYLVPPPTPTPTPTVPPPSSAKINNIVGHAQLYTLDCEARSAVDLAAYFGVNIDENSFLKKMPHSSNPNLGFVGSYTGERGKIPPNSYGVYAGPIAAMLRSYGLNASEQHGMSYEALTQEISVGRPVMIWVTANTEVGWSTPYTTPDGQKITVAPFEHTVIVVGYDPLYVFVLDGNSNYQRIKADFVKSWGLLGNMAVTISK